MAAWRDGDKSTALCPALSETTGKGKCLSGTGLFLDSPRTSEKRSEPDITLERISGQLLQCQACPIPVYTVLLHLPGMDEKSKTTMRPHHKPRDTMEMDWAGGTLFIKDPVTGENVSAYLFVRFSPAIVLFMPSSAVT